MCTNFITSAIGISRILIAAGVLLFVQLAIGVEICCHHPGDEKAWVGGSMQASEVAPKSLEEQQAGGAAKEGGDAV